VREEIVLHNHRVVLRTAGDGPPMLLVHGLLDSSTTWRRLAPALALRHRVIAVDLLGHGESDAPPAVDYSLLGHAMLLRDVLNHLEIERVDLVGHSLGGGIAMALAYLFPDRVDRIVLISSGGLGPDLGRHLRLVAVPGAGPVLRGLGSPPVTKALDAVAATLAAGRRRHAARAVQEVGRALARMGERTARGAFLSSARSVIGPRGQKVCALDFMEGLHGHPLLLFHGTADRTVPSAHSVAVTELHPNAQVVLLEGVGHVPHLVQPAYLAERITAFTAAASERPLERVAA
jgi:pimeloyl-ACP methyl ester carboxylesterase